MLFGELSCVKFNVSFDKKREFEELAAMIKQLLSATFGLLFCVVAVFGQNNAEQAVNSAREQFSNIKNRSIELERMKRDANKRPVREDSTVSFPKIKEDFEEIQKINSSVFEMTAAKTAINYNAVFKFVSEINHRAERLKSNLFAADANKETKNNQPNPAESPDIKILLAALDKSIISFVHNSIFQNVQLVNSQDSLDAEKELDAIIKISTSIKEKAKKLAKK